ncbi:thiamine pyrophosphate-requiring protein [Bacillus sp. Marseille-P3661]|uniref:thiamine pyrophosphate-requiring protein n=1 Tax=Bacillus sp. Marseille-P3661 TaxID=1936234 RepID=UPI0021557508|nr:thiamine pyrophosphate-requiring protein [Bacillus sp. Marseille-P3661]
MDKLLTNSIKMTNTTADAMIDALINAGVRYIFSNLGSDHPPLIESLAKAKSQNKEHPKIITCPHETVAMSAAHAYAQMTGEPQAVFVHLDVGTQNLGGAVHNAARARVPVFVFAGATPITLEGEMRGSRNRSVHFLQDVYDQRSIVRPYVKWEYEIRTGKNIQQLIYRALQLSKSSPQGPVYLMGAREILEEEVGTSNIPVNGWDPIETPALSNDSIEVLMKDMLAAENPLIITSYLGKNQKAVKELLRLCETLSIPVIEVDPTYVNFPADSPLHLGYESEKELLSEADLIIVIDCDVPWVPSLVQPNENCKIYYVDMDPLKEDIPLWYIPSTKFFMADSYTALRQLNRYLETIQIDFNKYEERFYSISQKHKKQRNVWELAETTEDDGYITPEFLSACIREVIDDEVIILDETVTNTTIVSKHIPRRKEGTYLASGGTSLGWNGGAAIGAKLACPDKTIVSLTGDGSYYFSVPSSVYWIARKYQKSFLTVIYNNQGWNATKQNTIRMYPDGAAFQSNNFNVDFAMPSDLAGIAGSAGGAFAIKVNEPNKVKDVLRKALEEVENGRSAVVDVLLRPVAE